MAEQLSFEILHQSQKWLHQLGQELSMLSGWGPIARSLRELRVRLGNPRERLAPLTPALLAVPGADQSPSQQEWFDSRFDYYYLIQSVSVSPALSIEVDSLACRLAFADENVVIEAMFPRLPSSTLPKPVPGMALALNGSLEWEVGIPRKNDAESSEDGELPAHVSYVDELQSLIVAPDYQFASDYAGLTAHGIGESEAEWRLQNPVFADGGKLEFLLVFRVPAGTAEIELLGRTIVEPDITWLAEGLGFYVKELPKPLATILRKRDEERAGAERLPIGTYSKWQLELPRPEAAEKSRQEAPAPPPLPQVDLAPREPEVAREPLKAERLRLTLAMKGNAEHGLAPEYLKETVLPYLQALIDIQQVIGEIQGRPIEEIKILSLRWGSISVDLTGGIQDVTALVLDLVVPWRRERLQQQAGATGAEAVNQRTELALVGLAMKMVKQVGANLPEEEQLLYAVQIVEPTRVIATSSLELAGVTRVDEAGEPEKAAAVGDEPAEPRRT